MHQDSSDPIEDEALAWLMRSTSGEFSDQQARKLEQWLAQSDVHRRAYAEAKQLWQGLGQLQDSQVIGERASQAPKNDPSNEQTQQPDLVSLQAVTEPRKRTTRIRCLSFAAAACLALLAIFLNPDPEAISLRLAEHHTATGEQRTLTLADGSSVYLNSASALNTDYSQEQRRIELIAGEAEFVVAKDRNRPFVVVTDGHEVKALGTDFIVKKQKSGVSVTVIESSVQVTQPDNPDIPKIILHPGERINTALGQAPGQLMKVKIDRAQAWRNKRLIFEAEPLDNVVAEINRYRPGHVFLSDNTLANYRVSGVFHIDQIDKVLAVIDQTLPVKSMSLGGRFRLLY